MSEKKKPMEYTMKFRKSAVKLAICNGGVNSWHRLYMTNTIMDINYDKQLVSYYQNGFQRRK